MCLYVVVIKRWKTRDAIGGATNRSLVVEDPAFSFNGAAKRATRYHGFFFMLCLWERGVYSKGYVFDNAGDDRRRNISRT